MKTRDNEEIYEGMYVSDDCGNCIRIDHVRNDGVVTYSDVEFTEDGDVIAAGTWGLLTAAEIRRNYYYC